MEKNKLNLYRFEYYEPLDDCSYVDWVWLEPQEVSEYRSSDVSVTYRVATKDEQDLYNEAYSDGYGVAVALEFESNYNGVTYRVEISDNKEDFISTKVFECGTCGERRDFETEVAMANGFYLTDLKGKDSNILWHICYECAMLQLEIDWIDFEIDEEGEANS